MHRICALALLGAVALVASAGAYGASLGDPTAITGAVSAVGGTSATLNGTVNPDGASTDWWFEYGTSAAYGTKTSTTDAGSGSSNIAVSRAVTGLSPGTTYHYRLVAKNASGTTNGADGILTTASPPGAVTGAASAVGPSGATVGGTVNPNGQPTTWIVEYGTTTSYGTKTAAKDAGSGTSAATVSIALTGLTAAKTYHFRLVATSAAGTTNGADATFVTATRPDVTTSPATSITSTGAKLNGKVDPNGRPTTYYFEYGTTTSYGTKTSSSSAGSGSSAASVSKTLTGLKLGTTYHFRIVATSDAGMATGADAAFTTQAAPTVATAAATAVGTTTATLGGSVNPNGRATTWWIEFGTTATYGAKTSSRSAGSGKTSLAVVASVANLKPGVVYHFRLVASNSLGTSRGLDATFTTVGAPTAVTGRVELASLTLTAARVNGTVNTRGQASTWWFEYGRTRSYGSKTSEAAASGAADVPVTTLLAGLASGVRWHYRVVARSAAGTTVGADKSFATPAPPRNPSGRPVRCTIVGSQAADVLRGTPGRDVICGLGGNDRILGGGRGDIVYGGPGADLIDGGTGNDVLRGGSGDDQLFGRSGNDRLEGGEGRDRIVGGNGTDQIFGGPRPDVILAKDGRRDVVDGGGGVDVATIDRSRDSVVAVERRRFA